MLAVMIDMDRLFLKIAVITGIDIHEFLRIAVYQGEPAALHLHHHPVAFFESMRHIRHGKADRLDLTRLERNWFFPTLPEPSSHHLPMHQHLVPSHRVSLRNLPPLPFYRLIAIG